MKKYFLTVLSVLLVTSVARADFLAESCVPSSTPVSHPVMFEAVAFYQGQGQFCPYLKSYIEGFEVSQMLISPILLIFLGPGARETIMAQMASVGVTLANPVVLTVVGVGAGAAVTLHIWVRRSLAECEQMEQQELKRILMEELQRKYGARPNGNETLEVRSR